MSARLHARDPKWTHAAQVDRSQDSTADGPFEKDSSLATWPFHAVTEAFRRSMLCTETKLLNPKPEQLSPFVALVLGV